MGVRAQRAGGEVRKHGKRPSYFGAPFSAPFSGYSLGHLSIGDSPRHSASSQALQGQPSPLEPGALAQGLHPCPLVLWP